MRATHVVLVEVDTCEVATWLALMFSRFQLRVVDSGSVEPPLNVSRLMKAGNFKADRTISSDDIELRDSPIFAAIDCRWSSLMLKMKSQCGFATLSTSAISLRGLAYFPSRRAECITSCELEGREDRNHSLCCQHLELLLITSR